MSVSDLHIPIISPGMELLFIILPKALSLAAGSSFWTVIYFLMTVLITLNYQAHNTLFPKTSGSSFSILENTTSVPVFDLLRDSNSYRLAAEIIPLQ